MDEILGFMGAMYVYSLIGMGIVQPIAGVIRLLSVKRYSSKYAIGLKRYLMVVVAYFLIRPIIYRYFIDEVHIFYLFGVSFIIAIGYMRHIWIWRKKRQRIEAYDKMKMLNVPCKERLELERMPARTVKLVKINSRLSIAPVLHREMERELVMS